MRLGALEAGGTKMVLAIGDENGHIEKRVSLPTRTPEETIPPMIAFFKENPVEALGIACFGPVDLDKTSPTYGYITSTPKLAWQNTDIVGAFKNALHIPVGFDTDVNGSCLGEATFGAAKGLSDAVYITVGTGVGMGILSGGQLIHGMMHPEAGHMLLTKHPNDTYNGHCPFHANCLEGLAAGPAVEERWGAKGIELAPRAEVWEMEAYYLAQAVVSLILTVSPKRVILGGGLMHQRQLLPLVREQVKTLLNGYIRTPQMADLEHYITEPGLGDDQGILGALMLAEKERTHA